MADNIQSVNLVLKTTDINADTTFLSYFNTTVTTSVGIISNNRQSLTWFNIDMKSLLGDMWDKFERFNISLDYCAGSQSGTTAETNENRTFQIKLKGLPFTSSYSVATGNHTNQVILSCISLPNGSNTPWVNNYLTQQQFTFTKQQYVSLTIDLNIVGTDTYVTPNASAKLIGHTVFGFTIAGVDSFAKPAVKPTDQSVLDVANRRIEFGKINKII